MVSPFCFRKLANMPIPPNNVIRLMVPAIPPISFHLSVSNHSQETIAKTTTAKNQRGTSPVVRTISRILAKRRNKK